MRVRAWVRGRRGVQESLAVEARDGGEGDGSGERVTERAGSGEGVGGGARAGGARVGGVRRGHPRSTSPAGNAWCPPSVAAGADRALPSSCCGAEAIVVESRADDDSVGTTTVGSWAPRGPVRRHSSRCTSCSRRSDRRKAWRASSCAKWPAPYVKTRATMARLTEVGWAQTVRTAMKSHSTSPPSDAVCQNSMRATR